MATGMKVSAADQKEQLIKWTLREQLILASAVQRSGDQNWVSVSRAVKPLADDPRPTDYFSQKNCAIQYSAMLDKASTPKRKRKENGGPDIVETVEEQIVRHLTGKRIKELDKMLTKTREDYTALKKEMEMLERGELDDHLESMLEQAQAELSGKSLTESPIKKVKTLPFDIQKEPQKLTNIISPLDIPASSSGDLPREQQSKDQTDHMTRDNEEKIKGDIQEDSKPTPQVSNPTLQDSKPTAQVSNPTPQDPIPIHQDSKPIPQDSKPTAQVSNPTPQNPIPIHQDSKPTTQVSYPTPQDSKPIPQDSKPIPQDSKPIPLVSSPDQDKSNTPVPNATPVAPPMNASTEEMEVNKVTAKEPEQSEEPINNEDNPVQSHFNEPVSEPMETDNKSEIKEQNETSQNEMLPEKHDNNQTSIVPQLETHTLSQSETQSSSHPETQASSHPETHATSKPEIHSTSQTKTHATNQPETHTTNQPETRTTNQPETPTTNQPETHTTNQPETHTLNQPETHTSSQPETQTSNHSVTSTTFDSSIHSTEVLDKFSTTQDSDISSVQTVKEEEPDDEEDIVVDIESSIDDEKDKSQLVETSPEELKQTRATRSHEARKRGSVELNETPALKASKTHDTKGTVKSEEERDEDNWNGRGRRRTPARRGRRGRPKVAIDTSPRDDESEEEVQSTLSSAVPSPAPSQSDLDSEAHQLLRNWRKTIMLVWRHAAQHKYANLFLHPVKEEDAPGYYEIVLRPMDLTTIKKNIETGVTRTDIEFQRDMLLMFQNAFMYNSSDHDVYKMAEEMKMDVMENIQEYLLTQMMVHSSGTKTLRTREARKVGESSDEKPKKDDPSPARKRRMRIDD